jgi:hypothetical protein
MPGMPWRMWRKWWNFLLQVLHTAPKNKNWLMDGRLLKMAENTGRFFSLPYYPS